MSEPIQHLDLAKRLARVIAADIALYNQDKIQTGFLNDNVFEVLADDIAEGAQLYRTRVLDEVDPSMRLYHHALVDAIFKGCGEQVTCQLW